ncbi:hypothetical protein DFH06DRAFT_1129538 [Mycena polygramma]|nr:hypothetical protein DFH06DRAFT_1129538 [Mycena polygramma]
MSPEQIEQQTKREKTNRSPHSAHAVSIAYASMVRCPRSMGLSIYELVKGSEPFSTQESSIACACADLILRLRSLQAREIKCTIRSGSLNYPDSVQWTVSSQFVTFECVRRFSERLWPGFSPSLPDFPFSRARVRPIAIVIFSPFSSKLRVKVLSTATFRDLPPIRLRHRPTYSILSDFPGLAVAASDFASESTALNCGVLLPEATRKKLMSALCRLAARAPIEAAEAYLNLRPYKEHPGFVYTHTRPNWEVLEDAPNVPIDQLDWVDIKVGQAENMEHRTLDYELDCVDEPIVWAFCYQTSRPKLIERLTHLTLWEMGAKRVPYACRGCGVHHREHFSEAMSGGLDVVGAIIQYWMRRIGEEPARIPLD